MARKKKSEASATGNDSREEILARVAKIDKRLDSYLQKLKSSDQINAKLRTAFGLWGSYPLWKEGVDSDRRQSSDEVLMSTLYLLQYKLNHVHKEATEVLMKRAEEKGIDSAPIWKSAHYCRELLANGQGKYYPPNREDDMWPGCLGESLYELSPDIRQAIQDGHAQVMKLSIKGALLKPRRSTPRCSVRDKQFLAWSRGGLDGYAIAAKWNELHPADNVSNEAVKKAIQRGRDK